MPHIIKTIDDKNSLIFTSLYPSTHVGCSDCFEHDVLVGIGGNTGDVVSRFDKLYHFWVKSKLLCVVENSPILKNPPFGYLEQDDFYNAVVHLRTDMNPNDFLKYMLGVEKLFGRQRSFDNAPRTLDIDIIFFNMITIDSDFLRLPHPKWQDRDSVLIPLSKMKGVSWLKRHL